MPENSPLPDPAQTIPQNDSPSQSGNQPENSPFEKIAKAGERVFAKFGVVVKRGRGRPRADGGPKKSDIVDKGEIGGPAPGPAAAAEIRPVVDSATSEIRRKIFVAGCVGLLKGAVGYVKKWVGRKAEAARIDKAFTEKTLRECEPDADAFKRWGDALDVCAAQYSWDFEHMPAVTLGVETVAIFAPFAALAGEFKKEIDRQRQKDLAGQAGGEKP